MRPQDSGWHRDKAAADAPARAASDTGPDCGVPDSGVPDCGVLAVALLADVRAEAWRLEAAVPVVAAPGTGAPEIGAPTNGTQTAVRPVAQSDSGCGCVPSWVPPSDVVPVAAHIWWSAPMGSPCDHWGHSLCGTASSAIPMDRRALNRRPGAAESSLIDHQPSPLINPRL